VHERQLVSTCATAPVIAALQGCQYLFSKRGYNLAIFGDNIPKAQEKHKNTKVRKSTRSRGDGFEASKTPIAVAVIKSEAREKKRREEKKKNN